MHIKVTKDVELSQKKTILTKSYAPSIINRNIINTNHDLEFQKLLRAISQC